MVSPGKAVLVLTEEEEAILEWNTPEPRFRYFSELVAFEGRRSVR